MMRSLFREKGAEFRVGLVADPAVQAFVDAHASALDSSFAKTEMSDAMRRRLTLSNYVFSGMKAFHELNEAFPSLLDENGDRKPFERFLDDVRKIDETYNARYLRAEYGFVAASAEMAARWEKFMEDGDRYYLQYRTQRDAKVRPEHAALDRVTLPIDDSFWEEFCPPNGWNCRCTVAQVRKSKYPATNHDEAMRLGDEALQRDTKGMFRFNPGREGKSVPDYNPYTISKCKNCNIAKGKGTLARFVPDNEVCQACQRIRDIDREKCEIIKKRKKRYKELTSDPCYGDVCFDKRNGGLKATHSGHITHSSDNEEIFFGKYTSTDLENHCQDLLFRMGHEAILCDESKRRPDGNPFTSLDLMLDGRMMDIRSITTSRKYGNALVSKNKQLSKYNAREDVAVQADAVCLYFEDPSRFSEKIMRSSINYFKHYRNNKGQPINIVLRQVFVVINGDTTVRVYDIR